MNKLFKVIGAILASLVCAATGAYILWQFHTFGGLVGGGLLVLLSVAIALPTPFHQGVSALKDNLVLIVPIVTGALSGGRRVTDPPKDEKGPIE